MKTNLEYYPRRADAHRHPKFKTLRLSFPNPCEGWAAEGRFWALNDMIADAENCQLDLSKKRNKATIAEALNLTLEEFSDFIEILVSEDVELLEEISENIFTTKKVHETFSTIQVEREKARKRKGTPEKVKSSPELSESSPELNNRRKEKRIEENRINKTTTTSSGDCDVKDFKDVKAVESVICALYETYAGNNNPDQKADLNPINEFLNDSRFTPEETYPEIVNSFLILKQANKTSTSYLLGIIKRKLQTLFDSKEALKKKSDLIEADIARKNAAKGQIEMDRQYKTERIKHYEGLYYEYESLFSAKEKNDIKKHLEKEDWVFAGSIIDAKIQETVSI